MFHVLHDDTGVGNHALAHLQVQIDTLNHAFADGDISFYLRGVNRIQNNDWFNDMRAGGPYASVVKQAFHVGPGRVLNVYLGRIPGPTGGYATFPGPNSGGFLDGVVIETITIPGNPWYSSSLGQPDDGGTLVHEVGHWLGLYHTFGTGNIPPSVCPDASYPACLSNGDLVCDTPPDILASNMPGNNCWVENSCPDNLGPGGTDAPDDVHNYMDYSGDFCWWHFTAGQFARMQALVAQYRPSLVNGDGATISLNRSLVVEANQSWTWYGAEVRFPASTGITVRGDLSAQGTTFTAADPAQGWSGLRYETGASGTLSGLRSGSTVAGVKSYGGAAVYVQNANLTLDGAVVTGSTIGGGAAGLYVTGSNAYVRVKNQSRIEYNEGHGIFAGGGANSVYVEKSTIQRNNGDGIYAGNASVFLYDSNVLNNDGYGTRAHYFGNVVFGFPFAGYPAPSRNNLLSQNAVGALAATSYAGLSAGGGNDNFDHNDFLRQSTQRHAYARTSSDILARCDYWGSPSGPSLAHVDLDKSSTFVYIPYLLSAGESCSMASGRPDGGTLANMARGGGEGSPSDIPPLMWEALQVADEGHVDVALALLMQFIQEATSGPDRDRAYAVLTRLARRAQPLPLFAFLEARQDRPDERPWALLALAEAYLAAGDAAAAHVAASALAEEYPAEPHALFGYAALHRLALAERDVSAAEVVLAAAEASWPTDEVTSLMRTEHMLWLAGGQTEGGRAAPMAALVASEVVGLGAYKIESPYPNPAHGMVTVPLVLESEAEVVVDVLDVLGRRVAVLLRDRLSAGRHEAVFSAGELVPGLYLLRAEVRPEGGGAYVLRHRFTIVH